MHVVIGKTVSVMINNFTFEVDRAWHYLSPTDRIQVLMHGFEPSLAIVPTNLYPNNPKDIIFIIKWQ
jgi:hypothetical protein